MNNRPLSRLIEARLEFERSLGLREVFALARPSLDAAAAEAALCRKCSLSRTRTQVVFGTGDPDARLMFVGEAPGYQEDRQGQPFVGQAGELLDRMIRAMGLEREEVYICNLVKCRPPGNRDPGREEIDACREYLERQLDAVRPEVIVALGAFAARALLQTDSLLGDLRGRWHAWRGIDLMPTYHPAYLLRTPSGKPECWQDLRKVCDRLGLRY